MTCARVHGQIWFNITIAKLILMFSLLHCTGFDYNYLAYFESFERHQIITVID